MLHDKLSPFFLGHILFPELIALGGQVPDQKSHLHLSSAWQNLESWQNVRTLSCTGYFDHDQTYLKKFNEDLKYMTTFIELHCPPHKCKGEHKGANLKYWKPTESPAAFCIQMLGILQDFRSEYGWGGDEKVAEDLGGGGGVLGLRLWVGWGGLGVGGGGRLTEIRSEG